jgi:signal transduction histidine kinase
MQQAGTVVERKRVETVVETLAAVRGRSESLAAVAHDARNMVAALDLYCDLLDQPGVLGSTFAHYAGELRLVAAASRKLVEKLVTLEGAGPQQLSFWRNSDWKGGDRRSEDRRSRDRRNGDRTGGERSPEPTIIHPLTLAHFCEPLPSQPVASLAAELHATRNLLAALAGPAIAVAVDIEGGALPVRITAEDLTRTLVNLVKNAVEAMPDGGELRISLREKTEGGSRRLTLAVEDSGPGIPSAALELIFAAGYTAHPHPARTAAQTAEQPRNQAGMTPYRGLGLAITRSIVEAAGGRIFAENRAQCGARIVMELPAEEGRRPGTETAC